MGTPLGPTPDKAVVAFDIPPPFIQGWMIERQFFQPIALAKDQTRYAQTQAAAIL